MDPVITELQKTLLSKLNDTNCAKQYNKHYFMEQVNTGIIPELKELEIAFINFF